MLIHFEGGTSFEFAQPPDPEDIIDIFFYKGTSGVDTVQVAAGSSVSPTIKTGDILQVFKNNFVVDQTQSTRTIYAISHLMKLKLIFILNKVLMKQRLNHLVGQNKKLIRK